MAPDMTQHSQYPCLPQWGNVNVTLNTLTDFTCHNADEKQREIARGDMVTNGDVGYLDAEGTLFLNERKRDMVISGAGCGLAALSRRQSRGRWLPLHLTHLRSPSHGQGLCLR